MLPAHLEGMKNSRVFCSHCCLMREKKEKSHGLADHLFLPRVIEEDRKSGVGALKVGRSVMESEEVGIS